MVQKSFLRECNCRTFYVIHNSSENDEPETLDNFIYAFSSIQKANEILSVTPSGQLFIKGYTKERIMEVFSKSLIGVVFDFSLEDTHEIFYF